MAQVIILRGSTVEFTQEYAQAHDGMEGGIGLRSACRTAPVAHWASWDRHAVVDIILRRPEESMTIRTVVECAAVLERTGFECPSWEIERHHHDNTVHEQAMMRSQRGPWASTAFTCFPTSRMTRIDRAPFRALLFRRLRGPLPLSVAGVAVHSTPLATTKQHWAARVGSGVVAARVCREGGVQHVRA